LASGVETVLDALFNCLDGFGERVHGGRTVGGCFGTGMTPAGGGSGRGPRLG
jgi:hypothetical protein